jgi:hypothetical protein
MSRSGLPKRKPCRAAGPPYISVKLDGEIPSLPVLSCAVSVTGVTWTAEFGNLARPQAK